MIKAFTVFFACLSFAIASAQVPQTVALQGQLFLQDGSPLPTGQQVVSISFHDGIEGDEIPVCRLCMVDVINGVFQVVLGGPDAPLPPLDKQYWVSVVFNGEELYPRLPLHAVPFAIAAKTAEYTQGVVPVGGMLPFAGDDASVGINFLPTDGRGLNSKLYPALYQVIGTKYGDGLGDDDPLTDFNLPDTRNLIVKGATSTSTPITFSDPIAADRVRLDNAAKGSVLEPGVMSTNELVEVLPAASFTFMIRVK